MALNTVQFTGKVHECSDIREAGNSTVCDLKLYQSFAKKKNQDGTIADWGSTWVTVTCWGKTAEAAHRLEKKQEVTVEGSLKYEKYQTRDGKQANQLKITAKYLHAPSRGVAAAKEDWATQNL